MKCTSCHINVDTEDSFVRFKCPKCMQEEIVRCGQCRKKSILYKCKKCGFEGP